MKSAPIMALLVTTLALVSGCASVGDTYDQYTDKQSAHQLVDRCDFELIDLAALVSVHTDGKKPAGGNSLACDRSEILSSPDRRSKGQDIDMQLALFADKFRDQPDLGRSKRNEIQERILGASDQRCNDFKTLLQKKFSNLNYATGVFSTASALAATIVNSVEGSKTLAGLAGLSSGMRAEYNQAYFANAATQVIVSGIDSRRRTAYEQILRARKDGLDDYPLEAAIKDGIRYHGLCSTISGLQEAGEAVRYYNEPGIAAATRTLARTKMLMDLEKTKPEDVVKKLADWQSAIPAERYLAGNPLGNTLVEPRSGAQSLMDHYAQSLALIDAKSVQVVAALKPLDDKIVTSADKTTIGGLAAKLKTAIEASCKPTYIELSQSIIENLALKSATTSSDQNEQLALKVRQDVAKAEPVKTGLDFLAQNFVTRTSTVIAAAGEVGDGSDATKKKALDDAVAKLKKLQPKVAARCEVTALE
jgi:hypothetical protein